MVIDPDQFSRVIESETICCSRSITINHPSEWETLLAAKLSLLFSGNMLL